MKKTVLISFFCAFISIWVSGKVPVKFGKVDEADLKMTSYTADTSASAVILCKYGMFRASDLNYTEITRIKILKKEGLDWGSFVFQSYESYPNVRGITTNLENGAEVKNKLDGKNITRQKISNSLYKITFNMPDVKVGSVIDIELNHSLVPEVFKFQDIIPVRHAELVVEDSPYIKFQKNMTGFVKLESTPGKWIARDAPAFHSEPYISSINNYITKFEFEVIDINFGKYRAYTTSWEAVEKILYESSYFGGALEGSLYLNSAADEINASCKTDEEKLKAAHKYVQKVRWNGRESLYTTEESMSYLFKQSYGNSTDINIILVQLLRKLGYEANPVVMSSRSNGILPYYPCWFKLNYVICEALVNGKSILMDATDIYLPYNLLPERALNYGGRMINRKVTKAVTIEAQGTDSDIVTCDLKITGDFVLKGNVSYKKSDYAAYDFRKDYKKFNSSDEYLEDFVTDKPGLEIVNADIKNVDDHYADILASYEVEIKNQLNVFDDEIYLLPMIFEQLKENPFKNDERLYPVDFIYPHLKMYVMKFEIPEGYSVNKIPLPVSLKLPDNKGSIVYNVSVTGNSIQLVCKISISNPLFLPTEYAYLKEFFNQIIKKQAEPVVLKKNS